jgi:hypothetical protein
MTKVTLGQIRRELSRESWRYEDDRLLLQTCWEPPFTVEMRHSFDAALGIGTSVEASSRRTSAGWFLEVIFTAPWDAFADGVWGATDTPDVEVPYTIDVEALTDAFDRVDWRARPARVEAEGWSWQCNYVESADSVVVRLGALFADERLTVALHYERVILSDQLT